MLDYAAKPWTPDKKDKLAVQFLLEHAEAGLLLSPGSHKTSIALAAFKVMRRAKLVRRALVIAPRRVCHQVWPLEARKWTDFHELKLAVLHGAGKEERLHEPADVYVINPEGLEWLFSQPKWWKLLDVQVLIVDELSKFKHSRSLRSQLIRAELGRFRYRWGLTGSPAPNGLHDLFGQMYVLDLGKALGYYVTHYRRAYFDQVGYEHVLKHGAEKKIYKLLKDLALRLPPNALPPRTDNIVLVELPVKARRVYDQLERELWAELDKRTKVVAVSRGVAVNKCRQVASGGVYYLKPPKGLEELTLEELAKLRIPRQTRHLHDEKTEAVVDLVEELQGSPLLVLYEYDHELERLRAALPGAAVYAGRTSDKVAAELEARWNGGQIEVLLAQSSAVAFGLNLQECGHHIAWYTLPWDYELYDQAVRRVWRSGQKKPVVVHHLIAQGTVDEGVWGALQAKARTQEALFKALEGYRKTRVKAAV